MSQIKFLLLHAQLKRFMKKGLRMLLYQRFLESMVTYSELALILRLSLSTLFDPFNNFVFVAATIFAYGQTSSGKTFTMRGITENAIRDIYECVKNVSYS